jgi:hypothetical protein
MRPIIAHGMCDSCRHPPYERAGPEEGSASFVKPAKARKNEKKVIKAGTAMLFAAIEIGFTAEDIAVLFDLQSRYYSAEARAKMRVFFEALKANRPSLVEDEENEAS